MDTFGLIHRSGPTTRGSQRIYPTASAVSSPRAPTPGCIGVGVSTSIMSVYLRILYLHSYDSAHATPTSLKHFLLRRVSKHPLANCALAN